MEISNTQNTYQKPRNLAGLGRRWGGQIIDSLVTLFLFGLVGRTAEVIGLPPSMFGFLAFGSGAAYYLFSDAMPNGQSLGKKLLGMSVID